MSGGSMNYLFSKIEFADFSENTPLRKAFRTHLTKVAKALHDIEWVDSCDYAPGQEVDAINECLQEGAELIEAIKNAKQIMETLEKLLDGR